MLGTPVVREENRIRTRLGNQLDTLDCKITKVAKHTTEQFAVRSNFHHEFFEPDEHVHSFIERPPERSHNVVIRIRRYGISDSSSKRPGIDKRHPVRHVVLPFIERPDYRARGMRANTVGCCAEEAAPVVRKLAGFHFRVRGTLLKGWTALKKIVRVSLTYMVDLSRILLRELAVKPEQVCGHSGCRLSGQTCLHLCFR